MACFDYCYAQKSDSVSIDYRYIGILGNPNYHTDSFYNSNYGSFRLGGGVTWHTSKSFKVSSWVAFEYATDKKIFSKVMFAVKYKPRKTEISLGNIPSMTANIRPLPPTMWGHFEPWTSAQIPGVLSGAHLKYFGNNFETGVGCYYINPTTFQYQAKLKIKKITLAGYYQNEKRYGGAMWYQNKNMQVKAIATDSLYGYWSSIKLSDSKKIYCYYDLGLNHKKIVRGEVGFTKLFDIKPVSGLFGFGYSYEAKMFKGYFLISIL